MIEEIKKQVELAQKKGMFPDYEMLITEGRLGFLIVPIPKRGGEDGRANDVKTFLGGWMAAIGLPVTVISSLSYTRIILQNQQREAKAHDQKTN